jgi:hypothetical protein
VPSRSLTFCVWISQSGSGAVCSGDELRWDASARLINDEGAGGGAVVVSVRRREW